MTVPHEAGWRNTIAARLSSAERADLRRLPAAERAAVDAWLAVNGWQNFDNTTTAQCPRCAAVGTRFVSRELRPGGPRTLACVNCVLGARQTDDEDDKPTAAPTASA